MLCLYVGWILGAMGSDAAMKAADVVLMDRRFHGNRKSNPYLKKMPEDCVRNIIMTLGIKGACLFK